MDEIEKTFENYEYSLVKAYIKPIPQRVFSDSDEKQKTICFCIIMELTQNDLKMMAISVLTFTLQPQKIKKSTNLNI